MCQHFEVCSAIPPHMLEEVVKNGDPVDRVAAAETLAMSASLRMRREVLGTVPVDAPSVVGKKRRTIYDAGGRQQLPGRIVRTEGSSQTSDKAVNQAYNGSGSTYDMFKRVFKRESIDDRGLRLDSTVHYGRRYNNAFWDGRQMVYGDGDGRLFNRFTSAIDVIGHELTHGVTQYEARLVYWDQSGALNESMSDVFGSLVKQRKLKQNFKQADWIVGSGLLARGVKGVGLRSMKNPGTAYNDPVLGKDPQPGHMRDFVRTNKDNGGVHINSGIPNRAFYLAAEQLNDSWAPGWIWYITLRDRLRPRSTFKECATMTLQVARDLHNVRSKEWAAVKKAWEAVGINP